MSRVRFPAFGPRPWVLGVLNVTPDSFSDGGRWADTDAAIARGLELAADGADVVDVGGESTRPGAHRVDAATERARVIPVITALAARGVPCSVDTTRAEVAAAAVRAGAVIVNDVSGGLADPAMVSVVAETGVPWILMHWRGPSDVMGSLARYGDVVGEVRAELLARVDAALAAGLDERSLIIDPGLGFAKEGAHNWDLLVHLDALVGLGLPVLIGASRKRFLGTLLADAEGAPRPPAGREAATAAVSLLAAQRGVWGVRVHEPRPSLDAFAVLAATRRDWQAIPATGRDSRATPDRRPHARHPAGGPLADPDDPRPGAGHRFGRLRRPSGQPPAPGEPATSAPRTRPAAGHEVTRIAGREGG